MSRLILKDKRLWVSRLLRNLSIIIGILLVVHLIIQTINFVTYPNYPTFLEFSNRVDVDDEASIQTWFSQFLLILAGLLAFVVARLSDTQKLKRIWYILSAGAVLISLDEVARLHEFVIQTIHVKLWGAQGTSIVQNAWLIILPFVAIGAMGILYIIFKSLPRRTFNLMLFGGVVYFSGAIGVEILSSGMNPNSWTYTALVTAFEEGLEMMGSTLLIFATGDYMDRFHKPQTKELLRYLNINYKK